MQDNIVEFLTDTVGKEFSPEEKEFFETAMAQITKNLTNASNRIADGMDGVPLERVVLSVLKKLMMGVDMACGMPEEKAKKAKWTRGEVIALIGGITQKSGTLRTLAKGG